MTSGHKKNRQSIHSSGGQSPSPETREAVLGVDTGGTFTDFVLIDENGLRVHKVLSTPDAPERAILQGLSDLGLGERPLRLAHGSTVATNALLEGKGARTAYVTNAGFEDVLLLGRQNRARLYDLQPTPDPNAAGAELRLGVNARMDHEGRELIAPEPEELQSLADRLSNAGVEAVAVNLLFSFRNDAHERLLAEYLPKTLFVSLSSRVLPEYREYERGMATWLNAYIGPRVADYLARLEAGAPAARVQVMQSSGGLMDAAAAPDRAVHLLLSGPAGGLQGARVLGRQMDESRLLSFDMGGTSTDVAMIDEEIRLTGDGRIGPWPVPVPMVDMHTIGAGGGSIATVDAGGLLRVGPESAGADPGPACYGRGGTRPTVTDANLLLGRIPKAGFSDGGLPMDVEAARRSMAPITRVLGGSPEEAAAGIVEVVEENMAAALRVMTIEQGRDPREFTLMSFGGAGGLHVCALAERLGMGRAVVPIHAGVLSALGMTTAPPARELRQSLARELSALDPREVAQGFERLEAEGRSALEAEGVVREAQSVEHRLALRYRGQSHALEIEARDEPEALATAFHQAHEQTYGHRLDLPVELVDLRVSLRGPEPLVGLPPHEGSGQATGGEQVGLAGGPNIRCLQRADLSPGQTLAGPALVTDPVGTAWIAEGWRGRVDAIGNLQLSRGK